MMTIQHRLCQNSKLFLAIIALLFPLTAGVASAAIPAFPGAEGFGAETTGGRGGGVVYVTNLNAEGSGSLNAALGFQHSDPAMLQPRYILFKVSGVVSAGSLWHHKTHIEHGEFTLAGHTAPGGIIVPGIYTECSGSNTCNYDNIIIRHLRSRPEVFNGLDDTIRLNMAQNVILDHCSFGRAGDEAMQISYNKNFTVQNSLFAETLGDHSDRGGVLIKYGSYEKPNDNISFHHNMLNRIQGRVPQVGCDDDKSNGYCSDGNSLHLEFSNNFIWDPNIYIMFKGAYLDGTAMNYSYNINMVNNLFKVREDYDKGMWLFYSYDNAANQMYLSGNSMNLYPDYVDYELMHRTNYVQNHPTTIGIAGTQLTSRHAYPQVSYTPTSELRTYMLDNVGAFPRDPMDRRLLSWVEQDAIDPTHWSEAPADDALQFDWAVPPIPPLDSDDDGMPDTWEICNGLDPLVKDHNGQELSVKYTGITGYENLEVYLNRLSDFMVSGTPLLVGDCQGSTLAVQAYASETVVFPGTNVRFTITVPSSQSVQKVELSMDLLEAPFQFPSPAPVDITASGVENTWTFNYTIPKDRTPGDYSLLVHVKNVNGDNGYAVVPLGVASPGDIDGNGKIELKDGILALQSLSSSPLSSAVLSGADINGDGQIGLPECVFILQKIQ